MNLPRDLIFRRMPSHAYPSATCSYDYRVVHLQSGDSRSTGRRQSDDLSFVLIPTEMLVPLLLERMKERSRVLCENIYSGLPRGFV